MTIEQLMVTSSTLSSSYRKSCCHFCHYSSSSSSSSSSKSISRCSSSSSYHNNTNNNNTNNNNNNNTNNNEKNSQLSSWTAKERTQKNKDVDYLYELGKNLTGNTNTNVGAKEGRIDDLFTRRSINGEFKLGADSDIANGDLRFRFQEVREFRNLIGEYFVPEQFLEKVALHVCKNFMLYNSDQRGPQVPLILGIWGGKGCGKTFNLELACKKLGMMPIVTSAGELEDESAGGPGRLIRERYRRAGEVVRVHGKMSCLIVNDIDAGLGWFKDTQQTVNNQTVCGTLMNLCDHPELVSLGEERREDGSNLQTVRIPIIVTGNDLSRLYAPLLRDGRMEKFYWNPQFDDIVNMVNALFKDDSKWTIDDTKELVQKYPNQPLDFFGATRSTVYDDVIRNWMIGNSKNKNTYDDQFGRVLMRNLQLGTDGSIDLFGNIGTEESPSSAWKYHAPPEIVHSEKTQITIDKVMAAAKGLEQQQTLVNSQNLSKEYMKWQKNPEDLTSEEREAMESKSSWQKSIQKREDERTKRRMEMRQSAASDQALKARNLMLEETKKSAIERALKRQAEIDSNPALQQQEQQLVENARDDYIPSPPSREGRKYVLVSVEEAFNSFKTKACKVVDVRDVRSFRRESVVGSLNIPFVEVDGKPLAYTYEAKARDFIEHFTKMFGNNKQEMIVLIGGNTMTEDEYNLEIDDVELNGLSTYLAETMGYENIAVVSGGYDSWVREYTPGGKKRLKEWSLDYVVGASGTTCVGAELPIVGSLADELRAAQVEKLEKLKRSLKSSGDKWQRARDSQSGKIYFYNAKSKMTQWMNPKMYNAKTGKWKLLDPSGEGDDEDEVVGIDEGSEAEKMHIKMISIDEAVERFYSKTSIVIDVRNAFDLKTESIEKMPSCPIRLAKGTKLSPVFENVDEDQYMENLLKIAFGYCDGDSVVVEEIKTKKSLLFVGGDTDDESAKKVAIVAKRFGFLNVEIVDGSVSKWLKYYTPSGKPKKQVSGGAYKTDLLAAGAFNPFAGES